MNKHDRGILYGMVFGDGCLNLIKSQGPDTARLTIGHSPKQADYLEYKNNLLTSIFGGKKSNINTYSSLNKKMDKSYTNIQICKVEKYFRQMHRILYPFGSKIYSKHALEYLTDFGLALWYMDDGSGTLCKNKSGNICGCMTRISTYCSEIEANIIKDWFLERYGINVKFDIDKRSNKYSLRMNTQDSKKFVSIVAPYIIESMKYKIQHVDFYNPRVLSPSSEGEDIV